FQQACLHFKTWQIQGVISPQAYLSVNLSVKNLVNSSITEYIERRLRDLELAPQCLNIEITESDCMKNTEASLSLLKHFRAQGMHISIDDFGTGYSSLSYLHQFPVTHLKIDKSFIHQIADQSEQYKIVKTIALLCKNLGIKVIAEGVETQQQLDYLKQFDCDYVQGYFFSKPLFVEDVLGFLSAKSR
ncbi:MAG: EAL domain-containing protein, partial [Prochlorotrichaceae cyanobacterium]